MTTRIPILIALSILLGACDQGKTVSPIKLVKLPPPVLLTEINKHYPDMRMLVPDDAIGGCHRHKNNPHPGFITADFNGDGINDYAVFLVSINPLRDAVTHNGFEFKWHKSLLAAFLSKNNETWQPEMLFKFETQMPSPSEIALNPPVRSII